MIKYHLLLNLNKIDFYVKRLVNEKFTGETI